MGQGGAWLAVKRFISFSLKGTVSLNPIRNYVYDVCFILLLKHKNNFWGIISLWFHLLLFVFSLVSNSRHYISIIPGIVLLNFTLIIPEMGSSALHQAALKALYCYQTLPYYVFTSACNIYKQRLVALAGGGPKFSTLPNFLYLKWIDIVRKIPDSTLTPSYICKKHRSIASRELPKDKRKTSTKAQIRDYFPWPLPWLIMFNGA